MYSSCASVSGRQWAPTVALHQTYLIYEGVDAVSPLLLHSAVADLPHLRICRMLSW